MTEIFVDSWLFVEHIKPKSSDKISRKLHKLHADASDGRKNIDIITSHIALGEVLQTINDSYPSAEEQIRPLTKFGQVFSTPPYKLSTVNPETVQEKINKVLEKDPRLAQSPNDCLILAQAVSENSDKIITADKDWSDRLEDLGIELKIL